MKLAHTLSLAVMLLGITATSALAQKKYGQSALARYRAEHRSV
jgi:hypothetical protein